MGYMKPMHPTSWAYGFRPSSSMAFRPGLHQRAAAREEEEWAKKNKDLWDPYTQESTARVRAFRAMVKHLPQKIKDNPMAMAKILAGSLKQAAYSTPATYKGGKGVNIPNLGGGRYGRGRAGYRGGGEDGDGKDTGYFGAGGSTEPPKSVKELEGEERSKAIARMESDEKFRELSAREGIRKQAEEIKADEPRRIAMVNRVAKQHGWDKATAGAYLDTLKSGGTAAAVKQFYPPLQPPPSFAHDDFGVISNISTFLGANAPGAEEFGRSLRDSAGKGYGGGWRREPDQYTLKEMGSKTKELRRAARGRYAKGLYKGVSSVAKSGTITNRMDRTPQLQPGVDPRSYEARIGWTEEDERRARERALNY